MSSNETSQTGQLAAELDDACVATAQARDLVFKAAAEVLAGITRKHFPTATMVTVEPSDGALVGIHTDAGRAWSAYDHAPNSVLPLPALDEAHRVLAAVLAFGRDHATVTAAGWEPIPSGAGLYHVTLPGDPAERPAAEQRPTWSVETIRAVDVVDNDEVMIDGRWREVLDVWDDESDPAAQFGEDHEFTQQIRAKVNWLSPTYIALRLADDEKSRFDEVVSEIRVIRCRDLIQVQRMNAPAPADVLADVLAVVEPLDVRGALRAGTELWAETGDPQDVLSESQRETLSTLRAHFTSIDDQ
ncbi:hypothetical protein [Streptomyces sp. NPDC053560]|uniref:hypothetical protein n=1 Tax=Streptomyces sp. NPDC053560 TaxID=3365711 RepID=UPI0037D22441